MLQHPELDAIKHTQSQTNEVEIEMLPKAFHLNKCIRSLKNDHHSKQNYSQDNMLTNVNSIRL